MSHISRRDMLLISGAFALSTLSASAIGVESRTANPNLKKDTIDSWLKVKWLADTDSIALLDSLFPGFKNTDVFNQLRNSCYIVTNVADKPLNAISVRWAITTNKGNYSAVKSLYFRPRGHKHPHMHWGHKGNKTRFSANVPALKGGATKLVCPFFAISPNHYGRFGVDRIKKRLTANRKGSFPITPRELDQNQVATQMEIDAIVVRKNRVIGPDKAGLARMLRVTRNAEHDEAYSIYRHMQQGANRQKIEAVLESHVSGTAFAFDRKHDLYYRVRQREASVLLRRLRRAQWEQFSRTVSYLKQQKNTKIRRNA